MTRPFTTRFSLLVIINNEVVSGCLNIRVISFKKFWVMSTFRMHITISIIIPDNFITLLP